MSQRFSVDVLVRHINIDTFDWHRQQFSIINFIGTATKETYQHFAAPCHRHDVSGVDHSVCHSVQEFPVPPNSLHEHTLVRNQRLRFLARLADDRPAFLHAKRAQLKLVPGRTGAAGFLLAPMYLLIPLARCLKVDAKERRTNQRQNNGGSDGSENVGDGVGHRHRIQCFLGFLGRQTEAVDRIGRQAH